MGQRGGWFPRNATDRSVRAKDPRHPGSLRTGSHNAKLAAEEFLWADIEVTRRGHPDFARRFLAADLQAKSGVPASAIRLKQMIGSRAFGST
jgi:hypothetical protein